MIRRIVIIAALLLFIASTSHALDPETHEAINEKVATGKIEDFSLDAYLKNQLGFTNGIDEVVYKYKKIWQWLSLGGLYEDKPPRAVPYLRSMNHFHNPLKDWDKAGLNELFTGQSSILWAQNKNQDVGGKYSWQNAREI